VVLLLAIPILIQVYFNASLTYLRSAATFFWSAVSARPAAARSNPRGRETGKR
jgi:hypothetical protein